MSSRLTITCDDTQRSITGGELSFGRTAEFAVGASNRFVHRTVGRFVLQDGYWWLENLSSHLPLVVAGAGNRVELTARSNASGSAVTVLIGPAFCVTFTAGGVLYELVGKIAESVVLPAPDPSEAIGSETIGTLDLTAEEQQLIDALAGPVLRAPVPGPDALPSNKAVARQLGWPSTKFNRKLDYLCHRLSKLGFQGLKGDLGDEAKLRRWRLVSYAVSHGLVTVAPIETEGEQSGRAQSPRHLG